MQQFVKLETLEKQSLPDFQKLVNTTLDLYGNVAEVELCYLASLMEEKVEQLSSIDYDINQEDDFRFYLIIRNRIANLQTKINFVNGYIANPQGPRLSRRLTGPGQLGNGKPEEVYWHGS